MCKRKGMEEREGGGGRGLKGRGIGREGGPLKGSR